MCKMPVLYPVSLIELLWQVWVGNDRGGAGVAHAVEEGEPEEGVVGLVTVAIKDEHAEDHSEINEGRHVSGIDESLQFRKGLFVVNC